MPTAVLVDGEFFLKRLRFLRGDMTPHQAAVTLRWMAREHVRRDSRELYRMFFYDCPPLLKKAHRPVSHKGIDFSQTPTGLWRQEFHSEVRKLRKTALRLGVLNEKSGKWKLDDEAQKALLSKKRTFDDLKDEDFRYDVSQKGVDMRIGLDIASMAFKRQVKQIVLVAGDSDFVPAAKLARREGIDFILDPMWARIRDDLHEHIDGLRSTIKKDAEPLNGNGDETA
jgi:uncharacterized LabA/DUF88 family protein